MIGALILKMALGKPLIRFRDGLIKFLMPVLAGTFTLSTAAGIPIPQSKKAAATPSPTPMAAPKPVAEQPVMATPALPASG